MISLSKAQLEGAFKAQPLFESKSWKLSPLAFRLSPEQAEDLEAIGQACVAFYRAQDRLYWAAKNGQSLLRNQDYKAPWVATYLDRGKPSFLLDYSSWLSKSALSRSALSSTIPLVIRPDLLWTQEGWILTELDAVPGGIGLTAFLYELYGHKEQAERFLECLWEGLGLVKGAGRVPSSIRKDVEGSICEGVDGGISEGSEKSLAEGLGRILGDDPEGLFRLKGKGKEGIMLAIIISEESKTYRPEWEWIAQQWRNKGRQVACLSPEELCYRPDGVYTPKNEKIDRVYRFFELFDWPYIPNFEALLAAERKGHLAITPPIKPHQEEKLSLALFHHPLLEDYWKEQLAEPTYTLLKRIIPPSWIVDFSPLPPGAYWQGPSVNNKPLRNYLDLRLASQKERNWILKISGFDETAWGSRGLTLGSDVSQKTWEAALLAARAREQDRCYILQDYKKPLVLEHPVYDANGLLSPMQGRLRLCPYYLSAYLSSLNFEQRDYFQQRHYLGALATLCPKDKKIIHGMQEAALLPALSPRPLA